MDNPSYWRTHIFQDGYCTNQPIHLDPRAGQECGRIPVRPAGAIGSGFLLCPRDLQPTKIMIFSQIIQQNGWHCSVSVANIGILNFKQQEKGDFSREKCESSPERNGDPSWLIGHKRQGIQPGQSHTDSPNAAKVLPRITLHIQYLDDP